MVKKVCIIAEAGVNHNGSLDIAKKLVDEAKKAGADIVKFQTFDVNAITSRYAEMAEYQKENMGEIKNQKDMLSELSLKHEEYIELSKYCEKVGIKFLSTPFDIPSIVFLNEIGCDIWKIPSGEVTNYPYLKKIAETRKPVILSTGMSTLEEVRAAVEVLNKFGSTDIILLHCTTQYPTPYESVNLNAMLTMQTEIGLPVGYSDHTNGIEVPIAAVAMGASVIEKHFTIDKTMHGPDHKASLEPYELKRMVESIRRIEVAKGTGEKKPADIELGNIKIARKSIIAARDIAKGEYFTEENLTTKRPGNGVSPMLWEQIVGTVAKRDFKEDELIEI